MKSSKTIIRNGLKYEEDKALQDFWENGELNRMIKIDPNIKPWEENYPYSREIWEFEASNNMVIATQVIDHQKLVIRNIAEGYFGYSEENTLNRAEINRYHKFIKGVDGNDFEFEVNYYSRKAFASGSSDWGTIDNTIGIANNIIVKPVDKKIASKYAPSAWEQKPFGNDFIKATPVAETIQQEDATKTIAMPSKLRVKNIDKITNFNPSTDTLEIDTDSFGIDSSATFASGKNKKAVKKKLAKQDFDLLYDEKKGGLYFNENGADKGFGEGGIIAILKGAPDLTSSNLEFI